MGGRGGSFGGGYGGARVVKSMSDGSDTIDLSDSPLTYGGKDKGLSGNVRKAIEQFEDKRWRNKIEFSRFVDELGNVVEERRGGQGSVGVTDKAIRAAITTKTSRANFAAESRCRKR